MMVLDTNIVLDVFVFNDPLAAPLKQALTQGRLRWLATAAMRDELERVLGYEKIALQLQRFQCDATQVLVLFDRLSQTVASATPAEIVCIDPDDQKFVDLALAHGATLITKDRALLALGAALAQRGVAVRAVWT